MALYTAWTNGNFTGHLYHPAQCSASSCPSSMVPLPDRRRRTSASSLQNWKLQTKMSTWAALAASTRTILAPPSHTSLADGRRTLAAAAGCNGSSTGCQASPGWRRTRTPVAIPLCLLPRSSWTRDTSCRGVGHRGGRVADLRHLHRRTSQYLGYVEEGAGWPQKWCVTGNQSRI